MLNDLIFAGQSASSFGILYKSHHQLRAPYDRTLINISGRNGAIDQGGGSYGMRVERVTCCVPAMRSLEVLRVKQRELAAWLARSGQLIFTDEPDKYYVGRIYDAPDFEQITTIAEFSLDFEVQPFAFGKNVRVENNGVVPVVLPISYGGTAPTHCRIIIRNASAPQNAENITITQFMKSAQGGQ